MIIFLFLMIISPSLLASPALSKTVTLNAKIVDVIDSSEKLSTEIVGPSFKPIIYNGRNKTFDPILFRLMATAQKQVEQFSFNVHYNEMSCSSSQKNTASTFRPVLSIEPGGVSEVNGKITLSGQSYWKSFEFNGKQKYISDLNFKVSFPIIEQLQQESMYCVGQIVLLSSIDI
ncbi:MAG: hypothetical protein ACRC9E_14650 [Plesiomonas shigelloides]